jgi:hypothetical protein
MVSIFLDQSLVRFHSQCFILMRKENTNTNRTRCTGPSSYHLVTMRGSFGSLYLLSRAHVDGIGGMAFQSCTPSIVTKSWTASMMLGGEALSVGQCRSRHTTIAVSTKIASITTLQSNIFLRVDLTYRSISESGSPVTPFCRNSSEYLSSTFLDAI